MNIISKLMKKSRQPAKGQSLVEMAVIVPILIFMMIGVIEVGWVLRNYLVLVNLNRELTRFAIRPNTLDFSIKDAEEVGYNFVLSHTRTISGVGQPDLDFETNSTLIISHLVVDTGLPCSRDEIGGCDCDAFTDENKGYGQNQNFTYDDVILHPKVPGYEYFTRSFPTSTITTSKNLTIVSQVDYELEAARLARQNNKFNCEFMQKQDDTGQALQTSPNNVIIVEVAYEQPQLFGFPLISNPLTDPVPLYSRTTMRLVAGARSAEGTQALRLVGPVCEAYPWYVNKSKMASASISDTLDVLDGWVEWGTPNYNEGNDGYLLSEVYYPQMAVNDFRDGAAPIAVGEQVQATRGANAPPPNVLDQINDFIVADRTGLIGKRIIVPVLDGKTIADFIGVEIKDPTEGEAEVDVKSGVIEAVYLGSAANGIYCEGEPLQPAPP